MAKLLESSSKQTNKQHIILSAQIFIFCLATADLKAFENNNKNNFIIHSKKFYKYITMIAKG